VLEPDGRWLLTRAVSSGSEALTAQLRGSRLPVEEIPDGELDESDRLPDVVRASAERVGAAAIVLVPVVSRGRPVATLELMRSGAAFDSGERRFVRLAAYQVAAAVQAFGPRDAEAAAAERQAMLDLAGDALAAGADHARMDAEVVRLVGRLDGVTSTLLWKRTDDGEVAQVASAGPEVVDAESLRELARRAIDDGVLGHGLALAASDAPLAVVTVPLGLPAQWALQLLLASGAEPPPETIERFAVLAARAGHALAASERSRLQRDELQRTRALLAVVAQVNSELSLLHAIETVVERVSEIVGGARVGVYLRDEGHLAPAAGSNTAESETPLAERLLGLALGPFRGRGMLAVTHTPGDPRLRGLGNRLAAAGIHAAVAVPLLLPDEVVGLLAVFLPDGRLLTENESTFLTALAGQLAVSVQNARLHEQATTLGSELEGVLRLERQAARQLRALYEISRSFAQSLSLDATLAAVARTLVELLEVDAALIRMPDERGESLVPTALSTADASAEEAIRSLLVQPQPLDRLPGRRLLRAGKPLVLDSRTAAHTGAAHQALVPFLEKGATAVVLPIATPAELLGTLTLLSLDRERPILDETVEIASSVARQAALALDNARLLQQQRQFAETMQRSLLPRSQPELEGLELGDVYESSADVEVGGDVYDYLTLEDGRLAVVLGDVTGHGIDAAADMAMAKFVFRSLAREHPDPGDFLAAANEVVCGEIEPGKFITMLYLIVSVDRGSIACASAGHPAPRLLLADGTVSPLEARGLALGIETDQHYEELHEPFPPGASVVLFTDGLIEARRDGDLFGLERLDHGLAERRALPPRELARSTLADCRAFSGGELGDDCAIVVIKRVDTPA